LAHVRAHWLTANKDWIGLAERLERDRLKRLEQQGKDKEKETDKGKATAANEGKTKKLKQAARLKQEKEVERDKKPVQFQAYVNAVHAAIRWLESLE
jgi:hypothetical protein